MSAVRKIEVTLPEEMALEVQALVETGAYASESELVRDAVGALLTRDEELDPWFETEAGTQWLREQVGPAYDSYMADPSRGIPLDEAFSGLEERYLERKKNGA